METSLETAPRRSILALCCEEPFRVFFPLGAVLGTIGVSLWPLWYLGWLTTYPSITHARLMIEGFMASYIVGFLGTAGPRITSSFPLAMPEVCALLTLDALAAGLHAGDAHRAGDFVFVALLLSFVFVLGRRFRRRSDNPPSTFILVALGLASGIAGATLTASHEAALYSRAYQFGNALLNHCFVLLPVLGVAPFFIRRLLDASEPSRRKLLPTALIAAIGLFVIASYALEPLNAPPAFGLTRALVVTIYFASAIPWRGRTFLADWFRVALAGIVLGLAAIAIFPDMQIGAMHIVFITGFNLLVFTVATRVVLGHSGQSHLFERRLPFFSATATLLILAMISRVAADLAPAARAVHLVGAAGCWLLAAALWSAIVLRRVTLAEP
ncbi:MAG: NnrS family protein [Chthoniobacterales bacterium]